MNRAFANLVATLLVGLQGPLLPAAVAPPATVRAPAPDPLAPPTATSTPATLSLPACLELALRQNRELQIERIQPRLAQLALETAGAAYDPILTSDSRWESLADPGSFDPIDLTRNAVYDANSESARTAITGLLPSGLTYSLGSEYAHSAGVRNSLGFESYSLRLNATVRQPLLRNLWIDGARLGIRANRLQIRAADQGLHFRVLSVAERVIQAFHELGFAVELHRTQAGLTQLRRDLLEFTRNQLQAGILTAPDESLAASRLASAEAAEAAARQSLALARHNLLTLVGDPWKSPAPTPITPQDALQIPAVELDLTASWEHADRARPDLAQLRTALDKTHLDVRFWRNQLLPALDVVASYGRRGASTVQILPQFPTPPADMDQAWEQIRRGDAPNQGIGFIFTMPLSRRAERSQYRASQELRSQFELRVRQHEEWIRREIADAHATALASRERAELTRQARSTAADALTAEQRRLEGGKSTLFVVLQLQSDLTQARIAEWRARADLAQAVNRLHAADGSLLERHGLALLTDATPAAPAPNPGIPHPQP